MCPNESVTYQVYATGAFGEKLNGGIGWLVYIDGAYKANLSHTYYSCGNEKDFYITPEYTNSSGQSEDGWGEVGQVELRVSFKGGAYCSTVTESKYITSRVPDPGLPVTSSGGLTFCPGETKTVYLDPGLPKPYNTINSCYFHHNWTYTVPNDWTVTSINDPGTGTDNQYEAITETVKVTAPAKASPGATNLFMTVTAEAPYDEWIPVIQRQITVGLPQNISVAGPSQLCTFNSTYSMQNMPSGANVNWSVSPTSLFGVDSGTGSSFTTRAASSSSSGQGTITATASGFCGTETYSKSVWVGKPGGVQTDPSGVPAIEAVVGNHVTINALSVPGGSIYDLNWWTNDNTALSLGIGGTSCTVECLKAGYYYVYVSGNNSCGEGIYKQIPFDVSSSGGGGECCAYPQLVISPNPAEDEVFLTFEDTESMEQYFSEEGKTLQVLITDLSGNEKYRGALNKNGLKVNLKHAQPGIHIVKVSGKDFQQQARLLIE